MSKSSSGHEMHPYVKEGIAQFGNDNWTTSVITRGESEYIKTKKGVQRVDGKILKIEIVQSRKNQQHVIYQKP